LTDDEDDDTPNSVKDQKSEYSNSSEEEFADYVKQSGGRSEYVPMKPEY
jgi:hypothetical protein